MNKADQLNSTGRIHAGRYIITFVAAPIGTNWIDLYDSTIDDTTTKVYATMVEVLETVTLLLTSETMREEFKNA